MQNKKKGKKRKKEEQISLYSPVFSHLIKAVSLAELTKPYSTSCLLSTICVSLHIYSSHTGLCCPFNRPVKQPQGLCTGCFICLKALLSDTCLAALSPFLHLSPNCAFLVSLSNHPVQVCISHSHLRYWPHTPDYSYWIHFSFICMSSPQTLHSALIPKGLHL